ncbi:MAG: DoxX family protein [Actinomycetes bacterium]
MDGELLLLRGTVGTLMAGHGAGKLFGAFKAGYGIEGTAGWLEGMGFRPGKPWAYLQGGTELAAGVGLATGLVTPASSAGIIGMMTAAARTAHAGKGPWVTSGGWELPLINGAVATAVAFSGPGRFSLDHLLGLRLSGLRWGIAALATGLGAAAATLAVRRPPEPQPEAVAVPTPS